MNAAERSCRIILCASLLAPAVAGGEVGIQAGAPAYAPGVLLVRVREGASLPVIEGVRGGEAIFGGGAPRGVPGNAAFAAAENRLDRWRRIRLSPGVDAQALLAKLRGRIASDPSFPVERAELNRAVRAQGVPDDPDFGLQYALHNTGQSGGSADADADAPEAWDVQQGSPGTVIAVVDSGVEWTHPDLVDRIWQNPGEDADGDGHTLELVGGEWRFDPGDLDRQDGDGNGFVDDLIGWDFCNADNDPMDDCFHGTHCAGIAAGSMNNAAGIAGMAPGCRIMPVKFLDESGGGWCDAAAASLRYAADMGARVLSNSWGGGDCGIVDDAIEYAYAKNALAVFAAGNDGSDEEFYPAAYERAFAVASTDRRDVKSGFSNYGEWVDIAAAGEDIWSCLLDGGYGYLSGTSMATPLVAGIAALLYSHVPGMNPDTARGAIAAGADDVDALNPGYEGLLGGGRANALQALAGAPTPTPIPPPPPTPIPYGAVVLNKTRLASASPFVARFRLDRSIKQMFAAYGVIVMPGGAMIDAATLSPEIRPIASMMPALAAPFEHTIVSTDVPAAAPRGPYEVVVALFDPWGPITRREDAFFSAGAAFEIQ